MLEYEVEKKSQNEFDDPEPTLADPSLEDQMTSIHRAVSDDDESEIEHDASSEIESLFANDDAEPSASTSKTTADLYTLVVNNSKLCVAFTGASTKLYRKWEEKFVPIIKCTNNEGQEAKQALKPEQWSHPPEQQLFVTMVWLRLYLPYVHMCGFFGLKLRYLPKVLKRCVGAILRAIKGRHVPDSWLVRWPGDNEAREQLHRDQKEIYAKAGITVATVVDGMHLVVPVRAKTSIMSKTQRKKIDDIIKQLKNGKHKVYATNLIVVVDLRGRLLLVDGPYAGGEGAQLRECDLRQLLIDGDLSVAADAGLHVNVKDDKAIVPLFFTVGPSLIRLAKLVVTHKDQVPADVYKHFYQIYHSSRIVSRLRIVVENTIAYLRKWRCLRDSFRHHAGDWCGGLGQYGVTQRDVAKIVSVLANSAMDQDGGAPRASDWVPELSDIPNDFKYGYPDNPVNAKLLEAPSAKLIYKAEGKPSINVARALLADALEAGTKVSLPLARIGKKKKAATTKTKEPIAKKAKVSKKKAEYRASSSTSTSAASTASTENSAAQWKQTVDSDFATDAKTPVPRGGSRRRGTAIVPMAPASKRTSSRTGTRRRKRT